MVLLLALSNSDKVRQDERSDDEENESIKIYEITHQAESEVTKAAKKLAAIKALLAEGEEPCRRFFDSDSDLSDWSDLEENFEKPKFNFQRQESKENKIFVKKMVTHLPGVSKPLEPPKPIVELEEVTMTIEEAKNWLERNLIPPYWVEEADFRASIALNISNPMPDSYYVFAIENYLRDHS